MAETDQIAPLPPEDSTPNSVMDEETRLRPEFVDKVLDAVDEGDQDVRELEASVDEQGLRVRR